MPRVPGRGPLSDLPVNGCESMGFTRTSQQLFTLLLCVAGGVGCDAPEAASEPAVPGAAPGEPVRAGVEGLLQDSLHLVAGRAVTIRMEGGEAQTMTVEGQTFGSHFEPVALTPLQRAARDSGAVADTLQPPDTGVVRDTTTLPDTGRAAAAGGGREPSSGGDPPGARTPEPSPDGAGGDGSEPSPPRKSPGPSGEEKR